VARTVLEDSRCIYCGEPADSHDHFPPRYLTQDQGFLLPCCRSCNELAGISFPYVFWNRYWFVKEKIKRKYWAILTMPEWDEEDIEILGPNLRKEIGRCLKIKAVTKRRLAWDAESHLRSLANANSFAVLFAESDGTTMSVEKRS